MKYKVILSLSFLFIAVFAFSFGLNSRAFADIQTPDCTLGSAYSCCVEDTIAGEIWGVWDRNHICNCQGYLEGNVYINPCNCPLGCGTPH